jgi:hypothetical protein
MYGESATFTKQPVILCQLVLYSIGVQGSD